MPKLKAKNFRTENSIWDKDRGTMATTANFTQKTTTTRLHIAYLVCLSTFKILQWFLQRIYFHHNRASFRNVGFGFTQGCPNNEVLKFS